MFQTCHHCLQCQTVKTFSVLKQSDHLRQDVCELIDRLASLHAQLERANKDYRREWVKCRVQKPLEQQTRQSRNRMSKKLHNMLVRFCGSDKNVREALCDMLKRYRDIGSAVIDTTALEKKLHMKIVAEMELSVEEALSLVDKMLISTKQVRQRTPWIAINAHSTSISATSFQDLLPSLYRLSKCRKLFNDANPTVEHYTWSLHTTRDQDPSGV